MHPSNSTIPIYHGRRHPVGISNAAKRLGVTRTHLSEVLNGNRKSARISNGYKALIAELEEGAAR